MARAIGSNRVPRNVSYALERRSATCGSPLRRAWSTLRACRSVTPRALVTGGDKRLEKRSARRLEPGGTADAHQLY